MFTTTVKGRSQKEIDARIADNIKRGLILLNQGNYRNPDIQGKTYWAKIGRTENG